MRDRSTTMIRLSKRMSELDICSRREADRIISSNHDRILVGGVPIKPELGQKVLAHEKDIVLLPWRAIASSDDYDGHDEDIFDTVVLNKPSGLVSGQPDLSLNQIPAVQLLTQENFWNSTNNNKNNDQLKMPKHLMEFAFCRHYRGGPSTLTGYNPSGRLDKESTGLLVFTRNGVIAKKLVSSMSKLEKEYIITVKPGKPSEGGIIRNLNVFFRRNNYLIGERRPLLPLVAAEWVPMSDTVTSDDALSQIISDENEDPSSSDAMRLVLKEGRKHQIRRMCQEYLNAKVTSLKRIRVGPILLDENQLKPGKWRFLTPGERSIILGEQKNNQ